MSSKSVLLCAILVTCFIMSSGFYNVSDYEKLSRFYDMSRYADTRGYYTVVAPGTILSESEYQISISVTDFQEPIWFWVEIQHNNFRRYNRILEDVLVNPESTVLLKFQAPQFEYGQTKLNVYLNRTFEQNSEITLEDNPYTYTLQTNKPKYKPGEVLQFRVICIDRLTRPGKGNKNILLQIYDGDWNLIKEITSVKLGQGVFKAELQISEYPVLGEWKILLKTGHNRTLQEKSFQVDRYILPDFSVHINTKKDITIDEGLIVMQILAPYTHLLSVKANLTILLHTVYSAVEDSHPNVMLEVPINNELKIGFNCTTDLNITRNSSVNQETILYIFSVEAMVVDAIGTRYSESRSEITVHNHPYKIEVKTPKSFDPEWLLSIWVSVKDLQNNQINDSINYVKLTIEGTKFANESGVEVPSRKSINLSLANNGFDSASFNLTNDGYVEYKVIADYLGWTSQPQIVEKYRDNTFKLDILTERPEVGKKVEIELTSKDPIQHFSYEIMAGGCILEAERINITKDIKTYILHINATYSMLPKTTLYVHRIINGIFDSVLKEFYIQLPFQNSIKINADDTVPPGASAAVNVTTDVGSYVGLMATDARLLLNYANYQKHPAEDHMFIGIRNFDTMNMSTERYPGIEAGLAVLSNANNRAGFIIGADKKRHTTCRICYLREEQALPEKYQNPSFELPIIQQVFSEGSMFRDFERSPVEGIKLHEAMPDTIASYAITGFSLNQKTGLALTKMVNNRLQSNVTTINVSQPLSISMEWPSLIKEGELINIPIVISDYNNKLSSHLTYISVASSSADLELPSTFWDVRHNKSRIALALLQGQSRLEAYFQVRPLKSGRYELTVTASSSNAIGVVKKTLIVAPKGVPYSLSKTYFINFLHEDEKEDQISIDIPKNVVPGSERVQLTVIGDIFGQLTESLQKFIPVPHTTGEDNMRYFVSNLMVLKYLKTLNLSNPSLESKAKLNLELCYQNQLSFKHSDGSFSFFDRSIGMTGDIWLTAYVIWGLHQAKQFITVDSKLIVGGLRYLESQQGRGGEFSSGKGLEEDAILTSFALLPFLFDDKMYDHEFGWNRKVIHRGLTYLRGAVNYLKETIPAVMSTFVLLLGNHESPAELLLNLTGHDNLIMSKEIVRSKLDNLQTNLESTCDNFFSLLESHNPTDSLHSLVRALVRTQQCQQIPTHMLALKAMLELAEDMNLSRKDLNIHFNDRQGISGFLHVNTNNSQTLQTVTLSNSSGTVHLQAKGIGFAIVNVKYTYNIPSENQSLSNYQTNITIKECTYRMVVLEVCVSIRSPGNQSSLTAIEINLQSGLMFHGKVLNQFLKVDAQVRSIQFNGKDGSILIYIQHINKTGTCIQLESFRHNWQVLNAEPTSVIVYDVHKEDEKSISVFDIPSMEKSKPGLFKINT